MFGGPRTDMKSYESLVKVSGNETRLDCRISSGVPLGEVADRIDLQSARHLFVEDVHGNLLGIVETQEILLRLDAANPIERQRWAETPLEAIVSIRLDVHTAGQPLNRDADGEAEVPVSVLTNREQIVAMNVGDDVMISWDSVSSVLKQALFDTVTGLPNRTVFDRRLAQEWDRVQARGSSIAVLMIDLDHFKQVNDRYGHSVGDEVLKQVAQTLTRQLRSYDLLVRYGGDEFAAILTDCYMTDIHIPAARLQSGVAALNNEFDFETPKLGVSIGAISCPGTRKVMAPELVDAADECLYAAKRAGRRCAYTLDLALSSHGKPRPLNPAHEHPGISAVRAPRPR